MQDRGGSLLFLGFLIMLLIFFAYWVLDKETDRVIQEIQKSQDELEAQELQLQITRELLDEVQRLRQENEELRKRVNDWLDTWEVDTWEATAYAPLDPAAVEGMCFEGDPNVTRSGEPPVPGETAAAHASFLGERIYVHGKGWRSINDIGGDVGQGSIDLVMESRTQALSFGRQEVTVVYRKDD